MTHICVNKLTTIGSDNGLSPERRQAIIWTNAGILLIGPLGTNFSEILIEIQTFSLKKIRLKMSSAKCCSFHLSLNVLSTWKSNQSHNNTMWPVSHQYEFPGHDICNCHKQHWNQEVRKIYLDSNFLKEWMFSKIASKIIMSKNIERESHLD